MSGISAARGLAFQIDEDRRQSGAGEAAQKIEARRFLKRALEPVGNLLQGVVQGRAGPGGLHDHRLDDKRRIFIAPETDRRKPDPAIVAAIII